MRKKNIEPEKIKFPDTFQIFGADLSLKRPGFFYAIVNKNDNNFEFSSCKTSSVDNKKNKKKHGEILAEIITHLGDFCQNIDKMIPIYFVREKAFNSRGAQSEIGIFEVVGITNLYLHSVYGKEWSEIYPVSVKKIITGTAKAEKKDVETSLNKYLPPIEFANDDESDAAAVAVSWILQQSAKEEE